MSKLDKQASPDRQECVGVSIPRTSLENQGTYGAYSEKRSILPNPSSKYTLMDDTGDGNKLTPDQEFVHAFLSANIFDIDKPYKHTTKLEDSIHTDPTALSGVSRLPLSKSEINSRSGILTEELAFIRRDNNRLRSQLAGRNIGSSVFDKMVGVARSCGYVLTKLDTNQLEDHYIAIPWVDLALPEDALVNAIREVISKELYRQIDILDSTNKPLGRVTYRLRPENYIEITTLSVLPMPSN